MAADERRQHDRVAGPQSDHSRQRVEHVFGDDRAFAQCHGSTILARADGTFLVAWFGGTREGHEDVAIWAADRIAGVPASEYDHHRAPGDGWTAPRRIAKASDEPHWNPVLFALDDVGKELVLHFRVGRSIRRWRPYFQRSHDGGQSWTVARPLATHDRRFAQGRGAVRNKPIRLRSGDWLAGSSLERYRRWDAFFDRSPDGVGDWRATPLVPIERRREVGKGIIQPTLWESSAGRLHALFRSTAGRIYRSDSHDDGHGWSPARPIPLPNNNSGLDLVRLPSGVLALACNPVAGNWAARTPLSILFSRDDGDSWTQAGSGRIDLETSPGEFSYPALIATADGLALSYTWNRRRIAFASIPAAAIPS